MAWLRMNLSPAASVVAAVFSAVFVLCLLLFLPLLYLSHFVSGVTDISGQLTTILAGIRRQKCMCRLRQGSRTGDARRESRSDYLVIRGWHGFCE
jgi:hypothetical protein